MPKDNALDAIGLRHGTDKASSFHDYLSFYEPFFAELRDRPLTVLEIGVLGGASLRTWAEYFPHARIIGADIDPTVMRFASDRIAIEIIDQSNLEHLAGLAARHGPFDIIIEDGSHFWEHQVTTLRTLFPFVAPNGFYVAEDLQTNFGGLAPIYRGVASVSCVDYLKRWVDLRVGDDVLNIAEVEDPFLRTYGRLAAFITFYRRACLIKKAASPPISAPAAGRALAEGSGGRGSSRVMVLAHVGNVGDVFGSDGFVNPGEERPLQGLSVVSGDSVLEYRVQTAEGWGGWTAENVFAGTRGQSKVLTGVTVRLRDGAGGRYALRTLGRFVARADLVEAGDGVDCCGEDGAPLCGIQIGLRRTTKQHAG